MPIEAINFINSKIFFGMITIDGTYLKFYSYGELIILTTLSGNHKIIPLGWGACPSENNSDLQQFYQIIKNNIKDVKSIKSFIMDEGPALNSSTKTEFPDSIIRNCYIHKKSNLHGKEKTLFTNLLYAHNKTEFNCELDSFLQKNQYSSHEADKLRQMIESFSPLFTPVTTQDIRTNGTCESINSILKQIDNPSIITYCNKLYDYMRTNIENMCKNSNNGYTCYFNQILNSYIYPFFRMILSIERDTNSNTIIVEECINLVRYHFHVIKDNGKIKCSCYKDISLACGCVHIYKALEAFPDFGNFDDTIHPGYKTKYIEDFLQTLPPRTRVDNLIINKEIRFVSREDRRTNRSRIKCAIDHNK